uniref:Uncharacterized protein n=1 Tax=Curvibacter symbiont subsp. Hydra magnipapillata TaxID=667019 RepID=C9YFL4_CURXX|nr:hypothetical protein Csp_B15640 [Curvibacter putative symbiont of Hydra magnipapillata]
METGSNRRIVRDCAFSGLTRNAIFAMHYRNVKFNTASRKLFSLCSAASP